jgi:hypothetical protein
MSTGFVFKNAKFVLNSVDLSTHCESIALHLTTDIAEVTAMQGGGSKQRIQTLGDFSLDVTFIQDFASGQVDATLFNLLTAGSVAFTLNPSSGSTSTSNPQYAGNIVLNTYDPMTGNVGTALKVQAKFMGDGAVTRATT